MSLYPSLATVRSVTSSAARAAHSLLLLFLSAGGAMGPAPAAAAKLLVAIAATEESGAADKDDANPLSPSALVRLRCSVAASPPAATSPEGVASTSRGVQARMQVARVDRDRCSVLPCA